jgi:ABC-type glycerol-3-phosphate transport system substrate-binding protein
VLKASPGAQELLKFLASPQAAEVWAKQGGYVSANKSVDPAAYPDETTRTVARTVAGAGAGWRYDMSDQTPAAFGNTPGGGEWKILQDFLTDPTDVDGTARKLENAAKRAYK